MSDRDPDMPAYVKDADYLAAVAAQREASDPSRTRLASANAGSGKTHVLVGRVSRLLLSKVAPEHILCLTYTKAAASEMQSRLFRDLGAWSVMHDAQLNKALRDLMGDAPLPPLSDARGLFARALETPEGLKVQTIHSFCAEVLKRFPMEAGILPGFEAVDDAQTGVVQRDVRRAVFHDAYYDPRGDLAHHLHALAGRKADRTLDELFAWMGGKTREIELFTDREGLVEIADMLGITPDASEDVVAQQAWDDTNIDALRSWVPRLMACSGKSEKAMAAALEELLITVPGADPGQLWDAYASLFFTGSGTPKKGMVGASADDDLKALFGTRADNEGTERSRVIAWEQKRTSARALSEARTLTRIAEDYVAKYRRAKREQRVLDYSDQIQLVHDLLQVSSARDWVRYKLDGGIRHILIDEAQDTSDTQWAIIDALRESFDPPDERGTEAKTFFAVGDEKQSIYSFQGAKPQSFIGKINDEPGAAVRMRMSFRSAPEILRVVDGVFEGEVGARGRMFNTDVLGAAGDSAHTARRGDQGRVELWPVAPRPDDAPDEVAWNPKPVDALDLTHPKEKLAQTIAATIRDWLATDEPVFDRKLGAARPMRPEDILILVRSRGDFFDAVIRNLKAEGVPVAGADRLVLSEAVVVKDLMALARVALFPGDDLSLAEVLKSPLLGYTEDDLFRVAHGRPDGMSLWQSVLGSDHALDREATAMLGCVVASVLKLAPYEFFATVLDRTFGGQTLRHRIERRLGVEARDPLNEFLGQVIAFQRRTSASLQHFVAEFSDSALELKREQGGVSSEVRIMTIHGAKGLEAPVVFLPQTTRGPKTELRDGMLEVEGGFLPVGSKKNVPTALEPYLMAQEAAAKQEHLRLLYVAMTRAESRLIICGVPYSKTKDAHEESWYEEVRRGMQTVSTAAFDHDYGEALAHGEVPMLENDGAREAAAYIVLPDWIGEIIENETRSSRRVTPSHLLDTSGPPPVRSPLSRTDQLERERRFLRGNLIHKLLEILPDIAPDRRDDVAERILSDHQLPKASVNQITAEVMRTLEQFPKIFAPGSAAEVSLAGGGGRLPADMRLNAQIDRLSVTDGEVFIVDYKSNRPPPETQDRVSTQYLGQMAAYRELAREVWPDKSVQCALLWTDSAHMMVLDEDWLDAALERIRAL